jgi:hypothetical protein
MKIISCDQGSPEWHQVRAGVITASRFDDATSRHKTGKNAGELLKSGSDYAFTLALERLIGGPVASDTFVTWAMRRGQELEPLARAAHERASGEIVDACGLAVTDCGRYGASLDGMLYGRQGGAEYKCFVNAARMREVLLENSFDGIDHQVQGCMMVANLDFMDCGLFCPELAPIGLEFTYKRVYANPDFQKDLWTQLKKFNMYVEELMVRIMEKKL